MSSSRRRITYTVVVFLAGIGSIRADSPIVIEVGSFGLEEAGEWANSEIAAFEKANPGILVHGSRLGKEKEIRQPIDIYSEIPHNVVSVSTDFGGDFAYLASKGLVRDLEEFLKDPDFPIDDYSSQLWDAVTFDDKRFGVPLTAMSWVLVYNTRMFRNAGIDETPTTWEEFRSCLRKLTNDTNGDGTIEQRGLHLWTRPVEVSPYWNFWLSLVIQRGGHLMENGRFRTGHPALREAYDFVHGMEYVDHVLKTDKRYLDSIITDPSVAYAMHYVNFFQLRFLKNRPEYQIMERPVFEPGETQNYADSRRTYLVMLKSTPEKEAASWKLMKWLTRKDVSLPNGQVAGNLRLFFKESDLERSDVKQEFRVFGDMIQPAQKAMSQQVVYRDPVSGVREAMVHCEKIVDEMFRGEYSFEEAMSRIELECNQILQVAEPGGRPYALYLD